MKKIKIVILALITALTVSSCKEKNYELKDYELNMEYKENFRICQLTDIHFGVEMDAKKEFDYLRKMITLMNDPNLIVITGDSFLDATKPIVNKFVDFIDSFNIPWTFTYGNHDLQGDYSFYYINEKIMQAKNSVFVDYKYDNFEGLTNFYININQGTNVLYRLYIIDSNCYYNKGFSYGYDTIDSKQLEHMENIAEMSSDDAIPLVFLHIPLTEYQDAYNGYKDELYVGTGDNNEVSCVPYTNNKAYDVFKKIGVKAVFSGHDHINNSTIEYEDGMILSYGVKSSGLVYHNKKMLGYKEITLPSTNQEFGIDYIKDVFVNYED